VSCSFASVGDRCSFDTGTVMYSRIPPTEMDTDHPEVIAAVGLASPTSDVLVAVETGLYGAAVSNRERVTRSTVHDIRDLDAELVPQDSGIFKEQLGAPVGARARDPDAVEGSAICGRPQIS
jgi:hypothetical protein